MWSCHHLASAGMAIEALQLALPNARILYSSATGASEPMNLVSTVWPVVFTLFCLGFHIQPQIRCVLSLTAGCNLLPCVPPVPCLYFSRPLSLTRARAVSPQHPSPPHPARLSHCDPHTHMLASFGHACHAAPAYASTSCAFSFLFDPHPMHPFVRTPRRLTWCGWA